LIEVKAIQPGLNIGLLKLQEFSHLYKSVPEKALNRAASKYVLEALLGYESKILYTPEGKPFPEKSEAHMSISHSHGILVVALHNNGPVGVDIELIRDKVVRVQHKYLTTQEIEETQGEVERLITFWAAKEALYKYYALKELDFCANLMVTQTPSFKGTIQKGAYHKTLPLYQEKINNHILVCTLHED